MRKSLLWARQAPLDFFVAKRNLEFVQTRDEESLVPTEARARVELKTN